MNFKRQNPLSRKTLTTLGATCIQNSATTNSSFTGAKSVAPFPYQIAWLKCSFHRTLFASLFGSKAASCDSPGCIAFKLFEVNALCSFSAFHIKLILGKNDDA